MKDSKYETSIKDIHHIVIMLLDEANELSSDIHGHAAVTAS